jgi:osmotically-inducible protein OsmY
MDLDCRFGRSKKRSDQMTVTMARTDHQIHEAVLQELMFDGEVDETDVGVEVDKGTVTLTGTVSNCAKKYAAQEAAHRVCGVLDVANEIRVHTPSALARTDTEIAQALRMTLEWDVMVPQEKVQSTVANGWVTLTGEVPTLLDKMHVERTVRNLLGVRGLVNNITVKVKSADAHRVKSSIEQALERHAEREADRIDVDVKDGTVSVTGRVHNWNEKQAVLGAARCASGVRRVEDHLKIDPYI